MKTEELTALGLSDEQVKGVFALNGTDINELKQQNATLTSERDALKTERDNLTTQLTAANDTLAKFGDSTPESMQAEIQKYKDQMEQLKTDYESQLTARDQSAWIDGKFDEYGVTSPYAKAALKAEIMSKDKGLPWRDGAFFGFDDFMKSAKTKDANLYQTQEEKDAAAKAAEQQEKAPKFMGSLNGNTPPEGGQEKKVIPKVW